MGDYTIFQMFEDPRRGRQARNFTTNVQKILDLKSSSDQIFFRKLSLGAPVMSRPRGRFTRSKARQRGQSQASNPRPLPALPPHGIYVDRCIMKHQNNQTSSSRTEGQKVLVDPNVTVIRTNLTETDVELFINLIHPVWFV